VPAQIEGATEPREDAEAAISTPSNRHAEVAEQTDQEPEEPDDEEPDDEEPEPDDEDDEPEEELEELATTSKSPFDRAKTPSSGEPVSTRRGHRSDGDSTPPGSGGHALGESGISTGFFESFEEPGEDELPPSSKEQPVYLTDDQIARKERAKVIVAVVVGLLGAVVLYVMLFGTGGGRGTKTAPAASTTSAASETSPASATPPASASAAPAASSATAAGGAGGAKATGGEGGAAATEEGEGGTAGDEKLPDVEDPLAEVSRLLNVGNYQDAIPMGKAAIAKHPDNGDAYFYLGQAYEALGKRDEALKVYAACVDHADKGQFLSWCKRYAPKK
jgi:hypothetical protein